MAETDYLSILPVEIWHKVLLYLLPVSEFLDPDQTIDQLVQFPPPVIENRDWYDSFTAYHTTESTRNCLRRVCRSWNAYLSQSAHRFIRMSEVVHGIVPVYYLKSAVRISFKYHEVSYCRACKPEGFEAVPRRGQRHSNYLELCRDILEHTRPFKTEIIDYGDNGHRILGQLVTPRTFPNLVQIQARSQTIPAIEVIRIIESFPSFRHMFSRLEWPEGEPLILKSPTLLTLHLSFCILDPSFMPFTREKIHLPALRHLHIGYSDCELPNEYKEPSWLHVLRLIGRELRTLHVPWEMGYSGEIQGEIWTVCPKLEYLHLSGRQTISPPPDGHPIHTLSIPYFAVWLGSPIRNYVPDWPGLRTVQIDDEWDSPLETSQLESLDSRLRLQDIKGESYADYLSRVGPRAIEMMQGAV
jgi:hypothetical protein